MARFNRTASLCLGAFKCASSSSIHGGVTSATSQIQSWKGCSSLSPVFPPNTKQFTLVFTSSICAHEASRIRELVPSQLLRVTGTHLKFRTH